MSVPTEPSQGAQPAGRGGTGDLHRLAQRPGLRPPFPDFTVPIAVLRRTAL